MAQYDPSRPYIVSKGTTITTQVDYDEHSEHHRSLDVIEAIALACEYIQDGNKVVVVCDSGRETIVTDEFATRLFHTDPNNPHYQEHLEIKRAMESAAKERSARA